MDLEKLSKRLQFAQLIIGDLRQTASEFMQKPDVAPIGVMLVDVDHYTATVPILNMLHDATSKFLPRVAMYFDDVGGYFEHIGEFLAITDFNSVSQNVKISGLTGRAQASPSDRHLYLAHLFRHEKYNVCMSSLNNRAAIQSPLY